MKEGISKELLQFITNTAFVGIERGYFKEADEMLNTVVEICPKNLSAKVARAMGRVFMGQLTQGVKELFGVLKEDPKNEIAKGFIALAFKIARMDDQAVELSQQILTYSPDQSAKAIAQGILEDVKNKISLHALQAELSSNFNG